MLEILKAPVPVFDTFKVIVELVVPTRWSAKTRGAALKVSVPKPFPERLTTVLPQLPVIVS